MKTFDKNQLLLCDLSFYFLLKIENDEAIPKNFFRSK